MDPAIGQRPLRRRQLGQGLLLGRRQRARPVHPEKDPARSIDLKELVDTLVLRGIDLPILIRFADILKHRWARCTAPSKRHRRAQVPGRLLLRLPHQGQPAAAGGGRGLEFGKPFHSAWKPAPSPS
jgi:hypothetical protein